MHLKIATFNFWGLPWPFAIRKKARLRMLAEMIRREQIDVLGCQEVWFNRDISFLTRQFPQYYAHAPRSRVYNRSGLLLLSRLPLCDCATVLFDMPMITYEFPSRKGLLSASIKLDGQMTRIINTHLLFTAKPGQSDLQKRQSAQLMQVLDNRPTLLLGDFNCDASALRLPPQWRLISESAKPSISMSNRYAKMRLNRIGMSDRLPDYIFSNFNVQAVKTRLITDPIMSDHYPVVSEIEA
ncbi:MAG: endonuclease/exonuclease/phosphatase family protein [Patescibacteria group bacterium]